MSHPLEGQIVNVLVCATGPSVPGPARVVTVATDWVLLEPLTEHPGLVPGSRWVPTVHILSLVPVAEET